MSNRQMRSLLLRPLVRGLTASSFTSLCLGSGIAACNIGGVTVHSFAGIGLGIESVEELVQKIRRNKKASARWLRTKVLIIDESLSFVGILLY
jgi:ATP-dependent DNA helicase PIF1